MTSKGTKWLCENASRLEQLSGRLVMFCANDGLVSHGETLDGVLSEAARKKVSGTSYLLHVPSKSDLASPLLPIVRKRTA